MELSVGEDEEECAAVWGYPPESTPSTELFRCRAWQDCASRITMRASCWCSFDSDRCSSRCVRTIRWHCAEHATGLTRPSSSGPRSATAAISATADSISESPSSPTRGRARISYRRSHWLGWRLSPAPRHLQRFRSVSRPDV